MWFGSPRTLILRGLVTIAFGVLLMAWPGISLAVLILLFGTFALLDGALILQMGFGLPQRAAARSRWSAGALAVVFRHCDVLLAGVTELCFSS